MIFQYFSFLTFASRPLQTTGPLFPLRNARFRSVSKSLNCTFLILSVFGSPSVPSRTPCIVKSLKINENHWKSMKIIDFHWFPIAAQYQQQSSRFWFLCAGKQNDPLSGWGQRSGFSNKNTNCMAKIQKIPLSVGFSWFFSDFHRSSYLFWAPYKVLILQYIVSGLWYAMHRLLRSRKN